LKSEIVNNPGDELTIVIPVYNEGVGF